jgi:SNF2 family DNA or RNA helicase
LLADDPGAGKTIMAGLLIKELKIRGLIKRILIITPANLSFQRQRDPGIAESAVPKKAPGSERLLVARQKKIRR